MITLPLRVALYSGFIVGSLQEYDHDYIENVLYLEASMIISPAILGGCVGWWNIPEVINFLVSIGVASYITMIYYESGIIWLWVSFRAMMLVPMIPIYINILIVQILTMPILGAILVFTLILLFFELPVSLIRCCFQVNDDQPKIVPSNGEGE